MWHWADGAVLHHPSANKMYWSLRARGSKNPHSKRKVMNKVIRGVFHCVTRGIVWDDDILWGTAVTKEEAKAHRRQVKDDLAAQKAKQPKAA